MIVVFHSHFLLPTHCSGLVFCQSRVSIEHIHCHLRDPSTQSCDGKYKCDAALGNFRYFLCIVTIPEVMKPDVFYVKMVAPLLS